jgi:hypothetical protein
MSNVRGDDAALEHELFGMLSKAKDCGLSGDALRKAFEAAYSQLDWRSDDDSNGSSAAEMPQKPRRGRHPIDDDYEIVEMSRLITEKGLTRWAATMEVARSITGENNNLKSRVNRLREKYRIFERHVERISDIASKFDSHIEEILERILFIRDVYKWSRILMKLRPLYPSICESYLT